MMKWTQRIAATLLAAAVAACGGGGGSPGATSGGGSNGGGNNGGGSTTTPTVAVSVVDSASAAVSAMTVGGSYAAKALVTDSTGAAVAGRLVTFSVSNSSLATLTPETALTDSSGVAQVTIAPASITALGAGTLTASASVNGSTITGTKDFSVSASNLSLSTLTLGSTSLASGGNTPVSVTALVGGSPASATPVNVTFSASCGRINNAASFGVTTNGLGVASASYSAVNGDGSLCSGPVTISASTPGATPQSASLSVAAAVANAIAFVSATPPQIFVSGSGALEQSLVTFKVLSGSTPLTNVPVQFSIVTNPGGVGLNSTGQTAPVSTTTNSQGLATVSVFSGSIPGPVKVRATLESDASVFAETNNLTVASGPPSQRFISVSVGTYNIEGMDFDGKPTTITARLADRQGNPVEDGTVVNFTAEGGQVASSCATAKVNGISQCSVTFESQNPRPANGRVSVLAYASGTKDYADNNANNRYDSGDTLVNIGDAYRDDNENAAFDTGEFRIPRGGASSCAGAGEPFPAVANTCDTLLATTVRQQTVILFSSTTPRIVPITTSASLLDFFLGSGGAGNTNLPMPSGTTIAAETSDQTASNSLSCSVEKIFGSTVPNIPPGTDPNANLNTRHQITLAGCATGDIVVIKITPPSGLVNNFSITLP